MGIATRESVRDWHVRIAKLEHRVRANYQIWQELTIQGKHYEASEWWLRVEDLERTIRDIRLWLEIESKMRRADVSGFPMLDAWIRARRPVRRCPELESKYWDGKQESLTRRTILLWGYHGFGDLIQYARFAPVLASRGATVMMEVRAELIDLFGSLSGISHLMPAGGPLSGFDVTCPYLLAPYLLQTLASSSCPYLSASETRVQEWRERLFGRPDRRLLVGIVWAGADEREFPSMLHRFCSLKDLNPLLEIEGTRFLSVRKGMPQAELDDVAAEPRVEHVGDQFRDFADTAAVVSHCDLIVTIDGCVAHLAGALGKPVWVLLNTDPWWVWGERETCAWYPSARLFREDRPGEWGPVIARVAEDLSALAAQHRQNVAAN